MANNLVAWTPVQSSNGPLLFSILVPQGQKLDLFIYLNLLADRLQSLIDHCPDPSESADYVNQLLDEAGLTPAPLSTEPSEAAQTLLISNPAVVSNLYQHGLPENLKELQPIETLAARQQIVADREDPPGRLESWVSAVSVLR